MWNFNNLFPFTNFHELNLDWVLQQIKKAVKSVNGTVFPDETGDLTLTPADIGAAPSAQGIPSGGTTGEALLKNSNTDYDAHWGKLQNMAGLLTPAQGGTGQTTVKKARDSFCQYFAGDEIDFTSASFQMVGEINPNGKLVIDFFPPYKVPIDLTITHTLTISFIRGNGSQVGGSVDSITRMADDQLRIIITPVSTLTANHLYIAHILGNIYFN